jgi:hypothetical protein
MIVLNKPSERTNSLFNLHFLDLHCKEQNPDYNIMSLDPTSLYIYIYIYKKICPWNCALLWKAAPSSSI